MSDPLLRYYNSELQYLRKQGDEFSRAHPDVAANLRIGTDGEYDPYVGRLVESFAYLNARTRQRLDDGFPEIAGSYLDLIYPHYQRPIPSCMVVQFELAAGQAEQYGGHPIARGTPLQTPRAGGVSCRFRTTHELRLWPLDIQDASLSGAPFRAPQGAFPEVPLGLLKLSLSTQAPEVVLSSFDVRSLRFFLRIPQPYSFKLYQLLFSDVLGVAMAEHADATPYWLSPEAVRPVGFAENEGLFDYPSRSFLGYRLLSEFFAFPDKFLFFDLEFPSEALPESEQLEIYFYTRNRWPELEPAVRQDSIRLGCAPCVNLFERRLEPIRLSHEQVDYPLVADVSNPEAYEVYSIDRVTGMGADRDIFECSPFYDLKTGKQSRFFWHAERRSAAEDGVDRRGTEVRLAFVDLEFDPLRDPGRRSTMQVDATCSNRALPENLPIVPDHTTVDMDATGSVGRCVCLTKPSKCVWPPMGKERRWRLVSHLALNQISLDDGEGCDGLKGLLELYAFDSSDASRSVMAGLRKVSTRPVIGRLPGDSSGAICRGIEIEVEFDESKYSGGNLFLFAAVLDQFFSLYANINSFTRMVAVLSDRPGDLHRWPAHAGKQRIL